MRLLLSVLFVLSLYAFSFGCVSALSVNRDHRLRQRGLNPTTPSSASSLLSTQSGVEVVNGRWARGGVGGIKADAAAIRTCIDTHLAGLTADLLLYKMNNPTFHAGQLKQHSAWVARAVEKFFLAPTQDVDHKWSFELHADLLPILTLAGYLHDIGKGGDKVYDFTDDTDPAKTKNHPLAGFEILAANIEHGSYELANGSRLNIRAVLTNQCQLTAQELSLVQLMAGLHYSFLPIIKSYQVNPNKIDAGMSVMLDTLQSLLRSDDIAFSFQNTEDLVDIVRMTMLMGAADVLGAQQVTGDSPQGIVTLAEANNPTKYQALITAKQPYIRFKYAELNNRLRDAVITWVRTPGNVDWTSPGRFITASSTFRPCAAPLQTIIACQAVEKGRLSGKAVSFWNKPTKRGMRIEFCADTREISLTFFSKTDCSKGAKAPLYLFPNDGSTTFATNTFATGFTEPWSWAEGVTVHVATQGTSRILLPIAFADAQTRNAFKSTIANLLKDPYSWLKLIAYTPHSKPLSCVTPAPLNPLRTTNLRWDWTDNYVSCGAQAATTNGLKLVVVPSGSQWYMGDKNCGMPENAMPGTHINKAGNPIWLGIKEVACSNSYRCADKNKPLLVDKVHTFTAATDLRLLRLDDIDNIRALSAIFATRPVNTQHRGLIPTNLIKLGISHPNAKDIASKVPNSANEWATSVHAAKLSSWALTLGTGFFESFDQPAVTTFLDNLADFQKDNLNRNLVRKSQVDVDMVFVEALCSYFNTLAASINANDVVHGYTVPQQFLKDADDNTHGFHSEVMLCSAVQTQATPTVAATYKLTATGLTKC